MAVSLEKLKHVRGIWLLLADNQDGTTTLKVRYRTQDGYEHKQALRSSTGHTLKLTNTNDELDRKVVTQAFKIMTEMSLQLVNNELVKKVEYKDITLVKMAELHRPDMLNTLADFTYRKCTMASINDKIIDAYHAHLDKYISPVTHRPLKPQTIEYYLKELSVICSIAVREGYAKEHPFANRKRYKAPRPQRTFLEEEELIAFSQVTATKYQYETQQSYLFACFTGLRYSDIYQLKGEHIVQLNGRYYVSKTIQKTKVASDLPLNAKAWEIIKDRLNDERIFKLPKAHGNTIRFLNILAKAAGITRRITFHSSRHTFAMLCLRKTKNIYIVKELLNHSNIQTTEVYAKILAEDKQKAVDLLDEI